MAIYKGTYSERYRRLTLHNHLCNFRCLGCTYKLKNAPNPERFFEIPEIAKAIEGLEFDTVHFMGGEPTTNKGLPELLAFFKHSVGVRTALGHTNGWNLVTKDLDATNVSIKFHDDNLAREYTGLPAGRVLGNFRAAYDAGLAMKASTVFIPGFGGLGDLEKIVRFVEGIDRTIPFHVMGYVPMPGAPWKRPTDAEMADAVALASAHLDHVGFSHLTVEELLNTESRDDRFVVRRVF
jgi:pyruvate formate lyase activating enzyme